MNNIKPSGQLERKLNEFSDEQRRLILKNTFAVQLTQGCSTGCTDCGFGAKKGVVDYIPFNFLEKLFSDSSLSFNNPYEHSTLYFASEPFDYYFDGKNYVDVHNSLREICSNNAGVITSIPSGKEELIFNLLVKDMSVPRYNILIDCISLTKFNYPRVKRAFENLDYVQKQGGNIFNRSYEIEFPNSHKIKYPKKINFERFLKIIGGSNERLVRNYYSGKAKRIKLGEKNKKKLGKEVISDDKGVILTPTGVYNIKPTKPIFDNPLGQIITPVNPKEFHVEYYLAGVEI